MGKQLLVDYLEKENTFVKQIGDFEFELSLDGSCVVMQCEDTTYFIDFEMNYAEEEIQTILEDNYGIAIRFCEECGKPYDAGYTAGNGDWYCCEECFEGAMNETYGVGKWRPSDEEGEYDGWYEYQKEDGTWEDTGIYYTEWN